MSRDSFAPWYKKPQWNGVSYLRKYCSFHNFLSVVDQGYFYPLYMKFVLLLFYCHEVPVLQKKKMLAVQVELDFEQVQ